MRVIVIEAPEPILTADDVRAGVPALAGLGDDLVDGFIAAATEEIDGPDGWLGRAIGLQLIELQLQSFPHCEPIRLPLPPLVEVESIAYRDASGVTEELPPAAYWVSGGLACPKGSWPSGVDVRVRYRAGYEEIPSRIKAAIQLRVGELAVQIGRDGSLKKEVVEGVGSFEYDVGGASERSATSRAVEALLGGLRVLTV